MSNLILRFTIEIADDPRITQAHMDRIRSALNVVEIVATDARGDVCMVPTCPELSLEFCRALFEKYHELEDVVGYSINIRLE